MTTLLSRVALVEEAGRLAEQLKTGEVQVSRNLWLSLLADFMNAPGNDATEAKEHLLKMLHLLVKGSGGHLARSYSYRKQVALAARVLKQAFNENNLSLKQFHSLFGWTARLLLLKSRPAATSVNKSRRGQGGAPQKERFNPIDKQGMASLEALKKKLEGG